MLPVDDGIDVCIAELDRCLAKGARGGFIPGFPVRPYHDPYYDPLYARVAEAGVPLTFHRTFGGKPSEADYDELVEQKITDRGHRLPLLRRGAAVHLHGDGRRVRSSPRPANRRGRGELRLAPVLGADDGAEPRHPRGARRRERDALRCRPPSCVGRNLFVTVLDDYVGFRLMADYPWMADASMYSSDYPHSVTLWPNSREHHPELTADLPDDMARKVLSGNAERLFGV